MQNFLNAFLLVASFGMMGYGGGGIDWAIFSVGVGLFAVAVVNYLSPTKSDDEPVLKNQDLMTSVPRFRPISQPKSEFGDRSESDFT